jgi:putative transposase
MPFNPDIHNRQSHRLDGFNYQQSGAYFITICTQYRQCQFGNIIDGEMHLNNAGLIIQRVWDELTMFYPNIETDEFIIMPDHIHGIIIVGAAPVAALI